MHPAPTFVPSIPFSRTSAQSAPFTPSPRPRRARSRSRTPSRFPPQSAVTHAHRTDETCATPTPADWLRANESTLRPASNALRIGVVPTDFVRANSVVSKTTVPVASSPSSASHRSFSLSPLVASNGRWPYNSPPSYCNLGTADIANVISDLDARVFYLGPVARNKVVKAVELARSACASDAVLSENVTVAILVADLRMDCDTICAAVLRTLVNLPGCSAADVIREVGSDVLRILTYHEQLEESVRLCVDSSFTELSFTNLRELILVRAADEHRAISLELARAVLAIRSVDALPDEASRLALARRTMFLYAPLANQLGVWFVQGELEELAFMYLEPESFEMIRHLVGERRRQCEDMLDASREFLERILSTTPSVRNVIRTVRVKGRVKGLYSVFRKMRRSGRKVCEIYDLLALRVIVQTKKADDEAEKAACYAVADVIKEHYQTLESRRKDYLANPKSNGYRSLHMTVLHQSGSTPFEIQIRSEKMHHVAEFGAAAHWIYKENYVEDQVDTDIEKEAVDSESDDSDVDDDSEHGGKPPVHPMTVRMVKPVTLQDKMRHAVVQAATGYRGERFENVSRSTTSSYPRPRVMASAGAVSDLEGECRVAQERLRALERKRQALRPGGGEHDVLQDEMRSGYVTCLASAIRTSRVIVAAAGQMYGLAIGSTLMDLAHGLGVATLGAIAIVNGSVAPLTQRLEMNDIVRFIQP